MKQFSLILLALSLCGIESTRADHTVDSLKTLSKYEKTLHTHPSQLEFLRQFQGDTIIIDIDLSDRNELFVKAVPDTVWLTKKRKKSPIEGKDFEINPFYKGIKDESGYYTPLSAIQGKHFILTDVKKGGFGRTPDSSRDFVIRLIDPRNRETIDCVLPESVRYDLFISVPRIQREIDALAGQKFYIQDPGPYSSLKTYRPILLRSGSFSIKLSDKTSVPMLYSRIKFVFEEKDGTSVEHTPAHFCGKELLLSEEEYAAYTASITPRYIHSVINKTLSESHIRLPFQFDYIIGTTKKYAAISQKLDPAKIHSLSVDYLPSGTAIGIGDRIRVKSQDYSGSLADKNYYKAFYNGKAFFIEASDVELSNEQRRRLDSLMRCTAQEREVFFYRSLELFKQLHLNQISENMAALQSYKKYGLNIESWEVYDESEYTDGTGIRFRFYNPTDQIIKYITVNFVGYNAVDDPVSGHGTTLQTRRCIGPIAPEETASYEFEYVWHTDVVEYAKIRSIIVQYKNGTTKTISNASQITFSKELNEFLRRSDPVKDFH